MPRLDGLRRDRDGDLVEDDDTPTVEPPPRLIPPPPDWRDKVRAAIHHTQRKDPQ